MGMEIDEVQDFDDESKEALNTLKFNISELVEIIRMQDKQIQKLEDKIEKMRLKMLEWKK